MARTGLRNLESRQTFVSGVLALVKCWGTTWTTAQRRAQNMIDIANKCLAAYHVPKVAMKLVPQSSKFGAYFGHGDWRVDLDRRGFEGTTAPALKDMAELVDCVYHECRHAEQWFLAARYVRTYDILTVDELSQAGFNTVAAQAADRSPVVKGSADEDLGERFAVSLFGGKGSDRIIQTQKDLQTLSDGSKASQHEKNEAKQRLENLGYLKPGSNVSSYHAAHKAYRFQLPEADAWDTGRLVAELYLRMAKKPPPPTPVHRLKHAQI